MTSSWMLRDPGTLPVEYGKGSFSSLMPVCLDAQLIGLATQAASSSRLATLKEMWSSPVRHSSKASPWLPVLACSPMAEPVRGSRSTTP